MGQGLADSLEHRDDPAFTHGLRLSEPTIIGVVAATATLSGDDHPSRRVLEKLGFAMISEEEDEEGAYLVYGRSL